MDMTELVIAVDPGREKCGVAVVKRENKVLLKEVVPTETLPGVVQDLAKLHNCTTLVIGDRTTSQEMILKLEKAILGIKIIPVNEHRSTDEARKLYWLDNPPKGFKRLIPIGMQFPPVPVDDYVAVVLAARYFNIQED
jgi:RNase H-fold protein (predicted Holliday junction resolvase)